MVFGLHKQRTLDYLCLDRLTRARALATKQFPALLAPFLTDHEGLGIYLDLNYEFKNSAERARSGSGRVKMRTGWMPRDPQSFAARVDRSLCGESSESASLAQVISECADQVSSVVRRPGHQCRGQSATRDR